MMESDDPYNEALGQVRWLFDGAGGHEPGAASLATADASGKPSVRTVTVVSIEDAGPVFFLRTTSGRGHQLAEDPRAALCFFWSDQQYQAIIEGEVHPLDEEETDRLWHTRPREAKLAAWLREVEPPADGKDTFEARLAAIRQRFSWDRVPRPHSWTAVCLQPNEIDLWHLAWRNPHHRAHYHRDADECWHKELLPPF